MRFKGCMVAVVTPMKADGSIDLPAFVELLKWHEQEGTQAVIVLGTTGESATILPGERQALVEAAIKQANARYPVIVGTGHNSTAEAVQLTIHAERMGADAALLVTPYYNKPTQEGLYQHYKTVAESTSLPLILYNVPGRTGCDLLPETVARLAKIGNIVAVKDATGDLSRVKVLAETCGEDFALLSGDDRTALDFMLAGGHGFISVTANVAPKLMRALSDKATAKEVDAAKLINERLIPLHQGLFVESNPIPTKYALNVMNKIEEGIRLPLTPLSEKCRPELEKILATVGI